MASDLFTAPEHAGETRQSARSRRLPTRTIWLGFLCLGGLYLLTATWSFPYNVDSYTNIVQARALADDGSPIIEEYEHLLDDKYTGSVVWIVESPEGPTSQYPPGVALWGAAFYLLDTTTTDVDAVWTNDGVPEVVELAVPAVAPGALAAVAAVLGAMVALFATMRRFIDDRSAAVVVAVVGLGTGAWSVAADQLWQHSPNLLFIALGTYLASTDRFARSGLAFAAAVIVRPHTALIAAVLGLTVAWRRRTLVPAVQMGAATALGLVAVVLYNRWVWGSLSISGGYGSTFSDRARAISPVTLGRRIIELLVDLDHGIFVSSPIIALALVAVAMSGRKGDPDWAVGAALGGAIYLLVQIQANRVSGGNHIFGYRYPLEAIIAAAPLLALCTHRLIERRGVALRNLFVLLVSVSIAAHAYGAVFVSA